MSEPVTIFGEITRLRELRGWSLRRLARAVNLTAPTVTNVESGRGSTASVCACARALGYSVRWRYRDTDGQRRLMLLPGSLATQLRVWRTKYLDLPRAALEAPGLSTDTIIKLEQGRETRWSTLERYALLMDIEPALIRGVGANALDLGEEMNTGGNRNATNHQTP